MSEMNTQSMIQDINPHKLDFTLSTQSHNSSLARLKVNEEADKLNTANKQKVTKILLYIAKRIQFNKRLFKEDDIIRMKQMFEDYQVWKQNAVAYQKVEKKTLKLVKEEHRVYFGQVSNHKKNGMGVSIYEDGRMYEGQYLDNQKHGFGIQSYPNGNVYNGNFQHNKKHGKGEMYWFSLKGTDVDEYYVGNWWGGLPFGTGKHQRSNGDFYQGKFKNGLKHGDGEQSFVDGNFYKGEYINGLAQGNGEYLWANGDYYIGQFKQGMKSGLGKWRNKDNTEWYEGQYLLDQRCGNGIFYDIQGRTYKGSFLNDKYHGLGQLKQGEEKIYRGFWQNGKPISHLNTHMNTQTNTHVNTPKTTQTDNPEQKSFQIIKHKSLTKLNRSEGKILNQSITKSYKSRNYDSANRRVITQASILTSAKELGKLRRPKSLIKMNMKSNLINGLKTEAECEQNMCGRKYGHKGCIPCFPWQIRANKILGKIGRERKIIQQ